MAVNTMLVEISIFVIGSVIFLAKPVTLARIVSNVMIVGNNDLVVIKILLSSPFSHRLNIQY